MNADLDNLQSEFEAQLQVSRLRPSLLLTRQQRASLGDMTPRNRFEHQKGPVTLCNDRRLAVRQAHRQSLACTWKSYFHAIERVHERLCASGWEVASGGYREAARMRGLFEIYETLEEMGPRGRRFVASCVDSPSEGDFGSMRARGGFGKLLDKNARTIDRALAGVPLDMEKKICDEELLDRAHEYLEVVTSIPGIGVAGATRILCAKRPDRFICLNGDNQRGLSEATGYPLGTARTIEDYIAMMDVIRQYEWYRTPRSVVKSAPPNEQGLWAARAAFLDRLVSERFQ